MKQELKYITYATAALVTLAVLELSYNYYKSFRPRHTTQTCAKDCCE